MIVKLIYRTPAYHKLVETVARVCYQSYAKEHGNSHKGMRGYLEKGHLSIASVGNIVFEVIDHSFDEFANLAFDLLNAHEITPFVKWTVAGGVEGGSDKTYVSMNMLTFLDLYNERGAYNWTSKWLDLTIKEVEAVPELRWFIDKTTELAEAENPYSAKGTPNLYEPILLDQDYTVLKELGLTEYELSVHATITANFLIDRAASLQSWRHWSGGCELSQRYVERGNATFRDLVDFDVAEVLAIIEEHRHDMMARYEAILKLCEANGVKKGRAKEAARSILSNDITTQLIQSRPLRNWLHLFDLRDSNHAQKEIRADVVAIKRELEAVGVPTAK